MRLNAPAVPVALAVAVRSSTICLRRSFSIALVQVEDLAAAGSVLSAIGALLVALSADSRFEILSAGFRSLSAVCLLLSFSIALVHPPLGGATCRLEA
jgi:hypothetical protein